MEEKTERTRIPIPDHLQTKVLGKKKEPPPFLFQSQTETIELPSKGLTYPKENPLSSGELKIYYPDTSHEELLLSQKLIKNGTAVDKFLESVIASPINYGDLIPGDKSALMIAARILLYGKDYNVEVRCRYCSESQKTIFDLTNFSDVEINYTLLNRENEYVFQCPHRKEIITYKLLTNKDEKAVEHEIKYRKDHDKKSNRSSDVDYEYSTRLKHMIIKVEGEDDDGNKKIIEDKQGLSAYRMLTIDAREFKKHLKTMNPTIDTSVSYECSACGELNELALPMTTEFFWPTA